MDVDDSRYAPLSALQHFVYCERQCALIHLERLWVNNRLTAEGNVLHAKVHQEGVMADAGVCITRGLPVSSEVLRLVGQCDVVEFHPLRGQRPRPQGARRQRRRSHPEKGLLAQGENRPAEKWEAVLPVEYKRGRPKPHEADRVQLCAQAICLEEMLAMPIMEGALFYGEPRRRTAVAFTPELRTLTTTAAEQLHALLDSGKTPPARYRATLCRGCSLLGECLPRREKTPHLASAWFATTLAEILTGA
ncbi:MAG: CRISPR-associated protein Cas4 [Magnetococcales bacterium]|nr:CRISPR-associated protein Cas4 [Magnetococcales bacterium]